MNVTQLRVSDPGGRPGARTQKEAMQDRAAGSTREIPRITRICQSRWMVCGRLARHRFDNSPFAVEALRDTGACCLERIQPGVLQGLESIADREELHRDELIVM